MKLLKSIKIFLLVCCFGFLLFSSSGVLAVACPTDTNNIFTTPGACTYTVPANIYSLNVSVVGGGGGGGGGGFAVSSTSSCCRGSGGNGGYAGQASQQTISVNPGQQVVVTVGGGGGGGNGGSGNTYGTTGLTGGVSSFGSTISVNGGTGGDAGGLITFPPHDGTPGGTGTNGNATICPTISGAAGAAGQSFSGANNYAGGAGGTGGGGCGGGGGGGGGAAHPAFPNNGGGGGTGATGVVKLTDATPNPTCGTAATRTSLKPTTNLCVNGTNSPNPVNGTDTGPFTWDCINSGHTTAHCATTVNQNPIVNAGVDMTINSGTTISFNDAVVTDPESDPLSYLWYCGGVGTLSSPANLQTNFIAPTVSSNTSVTCELFAYDNKGGVMFDVKNITVVPCGGLVGYGGKTYNTVAIGTQCWFKENLMTSTYADGTAIARGPSTGTWYTDLGYYGYPPNTANNAEETLANITSKNLGFVYQWSTTTNAHGLCPTGWHVPTDTEWNNLESYLTDSGQTCDANRMGGWDCSSAGLKLKSALVGGNNSSGFTALFAGYRSSSGSFWNRDGAANLRASVFPDLGVSYMSIVHYLGSGNATVARIPQDKMDGVSVRCLSNTPVVQVGVCGATQIGAAHRILTSGSANLCDFGTVSGFTGGTYGPWSWTCSSGGGNSGTCNATFSNVAPAISTVTGTSTIPEGTTLGLNVAAADGDGDISLNYNWTCTGGSLVNGNTANPTYTAPMVTTDTTNTCTVTVSDIFGASDSETVNITSTDVPVVGVCGSANGQKLIAQPETSSLCNAGDPSTVMGTGPWTWECNETPCGAAKASPVWIEQ